jgi:hypothetical protein
MTRTGKQLGADFYDLWYAARSLRAMSAAHRDATVPIYTAEPAKSFVRPDGIGVWGTTGSYQQWSRLRDAIVQMLHTNETSMADTADALDLVISGYRKSDDEARRAFEEKKAATENG